MPTDTARAATLASSQPARFALRLAVWSVALFGVLRLPWVGTHLLLPATRLQAAAGSALVGPSSLPVEATLACSGADALALCAAAIVAYPSGWRMRGAGLAGGAAVIVALNTLRIGTLGRAAASPRWFDALHVYVWPALLTSAIAGFVLWWMRAVDRRTSPRAESSQQKLPPFEFSPRSFALLAAAFLVLFTLVSPLVLQSAPLQIVAHLVARAAAVLLGLLDVDAAASAGVLTTPVGAFLVTPECVLTPLIPVYFAAVAVCGRTWRGRVLWIAAAAPLFAALGVARLLVVAVPGLAASPLFFIHAFSQLLAGAGMVCGLAIWRYGARASAFVRIVAALGLAVAFVKVLGVPYTRAIQSFTVATAPFDDGQGAFGFLPAFQFGLFLALWVAAFAPRGWTRFMCGASLLAAMQIAIAGGVPLLATHAGIAPLIRDIRAWALVGPALVIAMVVNAATPRR